MKTKTPFLILFLCLIAVSTQGAKVSLQLIATNFTSPLVIRSLPGSGKMLIADQTGFVYLLEEPGKVREQPVLDLTPKMAKLNTGFDERGLLGLALHPKFSENKRVFIYYSAPLQEGGPSGWDHTSRISEFSFKENGTIDSSSERVLMQIHQPYFNHNGGRIEFGPDGFLYIAVGDGGNANDVGRGHSPEGNGQDTNTLMGKILRIDVNGGKPYGIPKDNPFVGGGGKPEIFAYGLRNPWGFSFDRGGKRELFSADVGQNMFEEINIIEKGGNYGWRVKEGFVYFDPENPNQPPASGPKTGPAGKPFKDPIVAYKNFKAFPRLSEAKGTSVTGGYLYRGKALEELQGKYVFADWSRNWALPDGILYVASRVAEGEWPLETLELVGGKVGGYIVAMGEDDEGELYVLTNATNGLTGRNGKVQKIVPAK